MTPGSPDSKYTHDDEQWVEKIMETMDEVFDD